jgi:hypothetical protein
MINIKDFLNLNYYTSEADQFLAEFDKRHKKLSASQRAEIEKYERIYRLRDHAEQPATPKTKLWEKF